MKWLLGLVGLGVAGVVVAAALKPKKSTQIEPTSTLLDSVEGDIPVAGGVAHGTAQWGTPKKGRQVGVAEKKDPADAMKAKKRVL